MALIHVQQVDGIHSHRLIKLNGQNSTSLICRFNQQYIVEGVYVLSQFNHVRVETSPACPTPGATKGHVRCGERSIPGVQKLHDRKAATLRTQPALADRQHVASTIVAARVFDLVSDHFPFGGDFGHFND